MIAFPLLAALTLPALVWRGAGKSLRPWLLSWSAFTAAVAVSDRVPLVVFLGLFMVPAIVGAFLIKSERVSPFAVVVFGVSDLLLTLALTSAQSASRSWDLPPAGGWEEGALFLAAAAALRVGGAVSRHPRDAASTHLGWWQGLFLAALLGDAAVGASLAAAVLIWAAVARDGWSGVRDRSLPVAGGAVCLALALGATSVASLSALGVGGAVLAMGYQAMGGWIALAAPLSVASLASPAGAPDFVRWGSMALLPLAWSGAARVAAAPVFAAPSAAGILPLVAAGSVIWALWGAADVTWVVVSVAVSGILVWTVTSSSPGGGHVLTAPARATPVPFTRMVVWSVVLVTATLWVRLLLIGLSTSFL